MRNTRSNNFGESSGKHYQDTNKKPISKASPYQKSFLKVWRMSRGI
jgi:hypothetical protein